jgi:anti-sigma factor RsiW
LAHLGNDVAAFVDGQLSPEAMEAAASHLEGCVDCRLAVHQQQQLKDRMRGVTAPEPPPRLLESLSTLPQAPPGTSSWLTRLLQSSVLGAGLVVLGASMAVVAVAYVIGSPDDAVADEVTPSFDRYAAEYVDMGRPAGSMTIDAMDELDEYGWPCHARLGANLERVAGRWQSRGSTVALVYAGEGSTLNLFEQTGVLSRDAVQGFEQRRFADHRVWVREGHPRVVTWDADGVIYTIVTDLDDATLAGAIADLPRPESDPDMMQQVGDGLSRMTTWMSAA